MKVESTRESIGSVDRESWDLTLRMGSRFYRAPEIIACDPNYNEKVDVWGVGVVMAELMLHKLKYMSCIKKTEKEVAGDQEASVPSVQRPIRKFMFPGKYCFPLSPKRGVEAEDQGKEDCPKEVNCKEDQLMKIMQVMRPLKDDDLSFLKSEAVKSYFYQVDSLISD